MRQGRRLRAAGAAVRADRDGAHGRDRDLPGPERDLTDARGTGLRERLLGQEALSRLEGRMHSALRRARSSGGRVLISGTLSAPHELDPVPAAAASRRPGEPWFCFEQPDRAGYAIAGLGCVAELDAHGPDRFREVAARWKRIASCALADSPDDAPPGGGLVAVGGFAFASDGGGGARWEGFSPASLQVPELSLARGAGGTSVTVNLTVAADDTVEDLRERVERRLAQLRPGSLPLVDPSPVGAYRVESAIPPVHYEQAVAAAVERIRRGELEKVVLSRAVEVHAPAPCDAAALLGLLRSEFRSCYVFAVGRGEATFIGASPELLVRRDGQRATTVALAGSIGRSADPAIDDHLGERLLRSDKDREENAIVARRIMRILRPHAVWVTAPPEPALVRVANIQHLGTPIRAQLREPMAAIELAGLLHPTPAVGGEPRERAVSLIPALEGLDRGWYAGPVGWTDSSGDGEFCVALRCALLRGHHARLYAGCGIVRDSDPAAELAETEVKLAALLPLLAG